MTQLSSPPEAQEVAVKVERHGPVLSMGSIAPQGNASASEAR
jgi:hypothetical protein